MPDERERGPYHRHREGRECGFEHAMGSLIIVSDKRLPFFSPHQIGGSNDGFVCAHRESFSHSPGRAEIRDHILVGLDVIVGDGSRKLSAFIVADNRSRGKAFFLIIATHSPHKRVNLQIARF